jgi:hypothetical protein
VVVRNSGVDNTQASLVLFDCSSGTSLLRQ